MKCQIITCLLFVILGSFGLSAQSDTATRTTSSPEQSTQQRKGEVVDFEMLVRRFETAFKEKDRDAIDDLKKVLLEFMDKRVALLEKESLNKLQSDQLKQQKEIIDDLRFYQFWNEENYQSDLKRIGQIQQFAKLMKDNFSEE